jgi:hypothetical protein
MSIELEQKVRDQFERFEAELPSLMLAHRDEWVVYLDGPQQFFKSETAALSWAFASLPAECGFVVAKVAPQDPVWLSPTMAFVLGMGPGDVR